LLFSIIHFFCI